MKHKAYTHLTSFTSDSSKVKAGRRCIAHFTRDWLEIHFQLFVDITASTHTTAILLINIISSSNRHKSPSRLELLTDTSMLTDYCTIFITFSEKNGCVKFFVVILERPITHAVTLLKTILKKLYTTTLHSMLSQMILHNSLYENSGTAYLAFCTLLFALFFNCTIYTSSFDTSLEKQLQTSLQQHGLLILAAKCCIVTIIYTYKDRKPSVKKRRNIHNNM